MTTRTVLDDSPLVSARAAGMGGAIATLADDVDASYYNPAGIGGLSWTDKKLPYLRKLYFPYVGVAANENATKLNRDFRKEGAGRDSDLGGTLLDAHAGKRQYGRTTAATGVVFGRTLLLPYFDQQFAAVSKGEQSDLISAHYRSMSGIGVGSSIAALADERLHLGWYGQYATITQIEGEFAYHDIASKATRSEALSDSTLKYSGVAQNAGLIWNMGKFGSPTLAVVARNMGGTRFAPTKTGTDPLFIKEDLTLGFSMSPKLGQSSVINWTLEAGRISDQDVTLRKKFRTGLEYLLGGNGVGSYATLGLRCGATQAGASAGLSLNLGLVNFEVATHAEDIGLGNERVIERRNLAVFYVNVADF